MVKNHKSSAKDELNDKEKAVLNFIQKQLDQRGYPPSVREIGRALGFKSTSTVHGYLRRIESKGFLRRDPTKPRAIQIIGRRRGSWTPKMVPVPILGRVTAGQPILATQNMEVVYNFPQDLVGSNDVFMLRVKGNSMEGAGIYNGDLVLVRQQPTAENGEIVVAMVGEEATVKRFFRESEYVRLQPENPAYQPIKIKDVAVLGKVVGLWRRF